MSFIELRCVCDAPYSVVRMIAECDQANGRRIGHGINELISIIMQRGYPVAVLFTWGYVLRDNGSAETPEVPDRALDESADEKARRLSPEGGFAVDFDWFDALVYGLENKFDDAMPGFIKAAEIQPLFPTVHLWLALGYAQSGDARAARSAINNAIKVSLLLTLDYLKRISILHPDLAEHQRRLALLEPFWPVEPST